MILGILSDTHDNIPKVEKAIEFFNRRKAGFVLHAGDFVAPFTVDKFRKLDCDWLGVFGNNDGEKNGLLEKSQGRIRKPPLRLCLAGRKITLVHDQNTVDFTKERADLIIYGHSHKAEVAVKNGKLIVNPGECSGWLWGKPSVALVNTETLTAKIFKI
jgi:uncharacterized protein